MPLKLNLTIPNRAVHAFIALVVLFLVAGAVAYIYDSTINIPDPGHSLDSIQGYFNGDITLVDTIDKLQQRSTVTGAMKCDAGYYVNKINPDGTVTCEADNSGTSDITAVNGGLGLLPNTCTSGACTINVNPGSVLTTGLEIVSDQVRLMDNGCVAGEVLARNSSNNGWVCIAPGDGLTDSYPITARVEFPPNTVGTEYKYMNCDTSFAITNISITSKSTYVASYGWEVDPAYSARCEITATSGNYNQWAEFAADCVRVS